MTELQRAMGRLSFADRTLTNLEVSLAQSPPGSPLNLILAVRLRRARDEHRVAVKLALLAYGDSRAAVEVAS